LPHRLQRHRVVGLRVAVGEELPVEDAFFRRLGALDSKEDPFLFPTGNRLEGAKGAVLVDGLNAPGHGPFLRRSLHVLRLPSMMIPPKQGGLEG